jgi:G:T-mismatch repair DNA endonuclease (very short patch repair protein)
MITPEQQNIRDQVMSQIEDVIRAAQDAGQGDGLEVARKSFPGTPDIVLIMAMTNVDMQREDAWWQQVERTIEPEIIQTAIAKVAEGAE